MASRIRRDWSEGIPGWVGLTLVAGAAALLGVKSELVQDDRYVAALCAAGILCTAAAMTGALAHAAACIVRTACAALQNRKG